MNRREALSVLAGGVVGSLAGCAGSAGSAADGGAGSDGTVTGADGSPSDICRREARPGRIPAIVEPAFAPDWSDIGQPGGLTDATTVVGLERAGEARAYPITVLRLEIVNDAFDEPVLVTYCPLCSSGLTAIRRVDGQPTVFGNTSYTWRPPRDSGDAAIDEGRVFGLSRRGATNPTNDPNLVMFDTATGSYWSQLLGQAICGPQSGERLTLIPSTVTDWGTWREQHPETRVLLPPPASRTMTG